MFTYRMLSRNDDQLIFIRMNIKSSSTQTLGLLQEEYIVTIGKCLTHHRIEVTMENPKGYLVQTKDILHQRSK